MRWEATYQTREANLSPQISLTSQNPKTSVHSETNWYVKTNWYFGEVTTAVEEHAGYGRIIHKVKIVTSCCSAKAAG